MALLPYSAHAFRTYMRPATLPVTRASARVFSPRRYLQNILAPTDPDANSPTLIISKLTPRGFILSDNLIIPGGAILHSGKVLLWDVDPPRQPQAGEKGGLEKVWDGWEKERFGALEMLVPRPEILLLGTGQRALPAPKRLREYISGLGIQLDVMDSRNAASTYNLLVEEGRRVAAALCPLGPIDPRTGEPR